MRFLKLWKVRILLIFAIIGPGFITANVDNDAGGIYTYALAGAKYGYALLWTIIPIAFALAFAQEISARMGVVTGKGLSELIREEYGIRITFILMMALVLCNFGNVVSEFAGVASSMQLFGVEKYISVPIAALLVWAAVIHGDYKRLEKIFVFASFLYIAYIITGKLLHPASPVPGWASVMSVVLFTGGVTNMMLGLVGLYIAELFERTKQRPIYVIRQQVGGMPSTAPHVLARSSTRFENVQRAARQ